GIETELFRRGYLPARRKRPARPGGSRRGSERRKPRDDIRARGLETASEARGAASTAQGWAGRATHRACLRGALRRQGSVAPPQPGRSRGLKGGAMFESIVSFSLKNRAAILFLTIVGAIWGYVSFQNLAVEAFPDPTDTQVNIITLFPGQPSEEAERQIGLPFERALYGTPGLSRLRNLPLFGLSFI